MSTVVDARPIGQDKMASDRARFIRRARNQIRDAVKKAFEKGDFKTLENGKITVPVRGMKEPSYKTAQGTGVTDHVATGNKDYVKGDSHQKPPQGSKGSEESSATNENEKGEDEFAFQLTRDEFHEFFFEDLELPDLVKKSIKTITQTTRERAGYVTSGPPSQLDIRHTWRYAFARHLALERPTDSDIEKEENETAAVLLKNRQDSIPLIDDIDLRYRNYPIRHKPVTQAVMFLVMDVSGSMNENRKGLAKRFFLLLNILLEKKYGKVSVVFIRHHTSAEEVNEQDFFYKQETGGTLVSPALEMVNQIIDERYASDWNVYISHASDGDNWHEDNNQVKTEILRLLPKIQYYSYLQVAQSTRNTLDVQVFDDLSRSYAKVQYAIALEPENVWHVFRELFSKDSL